MTKQNLYIKTYGCAMNVYDSERMSDIMGDIGYANCEEVADADMVILNTCHIREKAAEKVYSELGRIRQHKEQKQKQGKSMIIAVAGCVGQAEGEMIFQRAPFVDIVVGPQSYQSLPDLVGKIKRDSKQLINLEMEDDKFDKLPEQNASKSGAVGLVSIQEGCDKFCTFCVVPYTRGAEYSRDVPAIYRESMKLAAGGVKEICLLGQNVNAFHGEGAEGKSWNLGQLITHIAKIEGIERIRYSTSHPRDMHEDLYLAHANEPKLMPYLNLPVQSGSNKILERMNRKHTRETYFKIIDRLRAGRPDMQFSSDFIIGFPGESDQDFEDTLDLAIKVGFSQAYSFKYSPRPGTPGAGMNDQVPEDIKSKRLQKFQSAINDMQLEFNQSCIGRTMAILLEKKGSKDGQLVGRTPYMQSVYIDSNDTSLIGNIVHIDIKDAFANSLTGVIL